MKITNGNLKSKSVKIKSKDIRPTSSKVREAIFNILFSLDFNIENKNILDLFAGSGIVSFEFISRGANSATLVDKDKLVIKELVYNVKSLGLESKVIIQQKDVLSFINSSKELNKFDLIYVDPPYNYSSYLELTNILVEQKKPDAMLIVEARDASFLDAKLKNILIKEKKYGSTVLLFF